MLAYKFRPPTQIEFALDILFNNRLYCQDWNNLNDPMEGMFVYGRKTADATDYSSRLEEIKNERKRLKICSLSMTFDCHLLWAHYAAGFSGMAIEVDLPDDAKELLPMSYGGVFSYVNIASEDATSEIARQVLSYKNSEWQYEKEVRVFQTSEWYQLPNPVRRIIVGHRMNTSLFDAMRIICERKNITINRTGIGDEGIDADSVPKLGEPW